jgi:DNA polymerase-1
MKISRFSFAPMTSPASAQPWIYVTSGPQLSRQLSELSLKSRLLSLDIETTGLDPWNDKLLLIQLGTKDRTLVIDCRKLGAELKLLAPILASEKYGKLGHNLIFDCPFLEINGLPVRGPLIDTYLASAVETAGELAAIKGRRRWGQGNGLAACCERWINETIEQKDELRESFIGLSDGSEISQELLEYGANDAQILFRLHDVICNRLEEQNLMHVWQLECRALPALIQMQLNGMKLDIPYYESLLEEESLFRENKKLEVIQYMAKAGVLEQYKCPLTKCLLIHPQKSGKGESKTLGFNLASPTQLGPALVAMGVPLEKKVSEKTGKTSYSCDKNVLAFHLADYEILQLYTEYKKAATRTQMVEKLIIIAKNSPNGRLRADYNQLVRTGRMSSSTKIKIGDKIHRLNIQQIPKEPRYRKGFIAEINRILNSADYSQLEIRLVAELSGDSNLIQIYQEGRDVHKGSAMLMTGKTDPESITKEERSAAKAINFGALYGAGAKTLRQSAISMFGILWEPHEAQQKLTQWKQAYPDVIAWQREQGQETEDLEVRTIFGRRRKLQRPRKKNEEEGIPKDESNYTKRLNSPIQGLGADVLKAALAMLWEQYVCDDPEIKIVACIHDEIILETPSDRAEYAREILQECMEDAAPLVGIHRVPIVAEPSSGLNWAELK